MEPRSEVFRSPFDGSEGKVERDDKPVISPSPSRVSNLRITSSEDSDSSNRMQSDTFLTEIKSLEKSSPIMSGPKMEEGGQQHQSKTRNTRPLTSSLHLLKHIQNSTFKSMDLFASQADSRLKKLSNKIESLEAKVQKLESGRFKEVRNSDSDDICGKSRDETRC